MAIELLSQFEQLLIKAETNSVRFERLCIAIVSYIEGGANITGTSTSWDRGRDGVGFGRADGIYLCTSLRDDIDNKALQDLARITDTTARIKKIYFCSSQPLSEHRIDTIRNQLENEVERKFSIQVIGAIQIAELTKPEGKTFEKLYGAETRDLLDRITKPADEETEARGLRLALISSASDEAGEIRQEVYANALLDILSDGQKRTVSKCSNDLSAQLMLAHPLNSATVQHHIEELRSNLLVSKTANIYSITEKGKIILRERQLDGASRLVSGRNAIKAALESAIGNQISHDDYIRIWEVFQDRLAEYFQSRGDMIVSEISTLLLNEEPNPSLTGPLSFLEDFAAAIGATSHHAERRAELEQAVKDIFADRNGEAAQWLVRVCCAFVTTCTLGLEYSSSQAVTSVLKKTSLALDTDVILSLLGEAEPDHESVVTIIKNWRSAGGDVLVATPVLEEATYHSYISQRDFDQVQSLIPGNAADRLHIIENVYVRSFAELVADKKALKKDWRAFIDQFRGRSEYDFSNLQAYLIDSYKMRRLPERSSSASKLVSDVNKFILSTMEEETLKVDKNTRDKASRDAELYVSLTQHIENLKELDPAASCILVSSARRLMQVDRAFRRSGERQLVLSIASVTYLVSLLPNARLGLSAMKAFLFDETKSRFSSDLERTVLRMLRASQERTMPFAKRGLLMRKVRERLMETAGYREKGKPGLTFAEVERSALRPENQPQLIQALAKSLDALAVDTRSEITIRDLRAENERLKREIASEKRKK